MTCRCLLRAYCFDGAVLASRAAKAFSRYARDDSFDARGKWLLAQRRLSKHVERADRDRERLSGAAIRKRWRESSRERRAA